MGLRQPALGLRHAAPAAPFQIRLPINRRLAGGPAGATGVVATRVVEQRVHAALAAGVKPSPDGGAGTAHRRRDPLQSPLAGQTESDGEQPLTPRARGLVLQAAKDQVSRAAATQFCPGSCQARSCVHPRLLIPAYSCGRYEANQAATYMFYGY